VQVAIVAKLRNGRLVRYREKFGLTQTEAARLSGIGQSAWNAVECMRFKGVRHSAVKAIAEALDCSVEDIFPESLRHTNLSITRALYQEMDAGRLFAANTQKRLTLSDPSETDDAGNGEALRDRFLKVFKTLTYREREILKLRYGLGEDGYTYTLEEVGKIFKVTRERVRMIEAKAIRKLQHPVRARQLEGFVRV